LDDHNDPFLELLKFLTSSKIYLIIYKIAIPCTYSTSLSSHCGILISELFLANYRQNLT
jgi:hypothetical protein